MTTQTPDGTEVVAQIEQTAILPDDSPKTIEEALKVINNLKGINKEVIQTRDETKNKLRKFEDEQTTREKQLLEEQGKFKELYEKSKEQLEGIQKTLTNKAIDSALKDIVQKAGARSVDTVAKLIDKAAIKIGEDYTVDTSSIEAQLAELRTTDPILFGVGEGANLPPVKRPSGGETTSGFDTEMRAAKSQTDVLTVMKKYGKI